MPPYDNVKIFVSSCCEELMEERLICKEAIEEFSGFVPILFEDWGARTESARQACLEKVKDAKVYLGIFYKEYSKPTYLEYQEAKSGDTHILIFLKELKDGRREDRLEEFINQLRDPATGHVCPSFKNGNELKSKLRESIIHLITQQFNRRVEERPKTMEAKPEKKEKTLRERRELDAQISKNKGLSAIECTTRGFKNLILWRNVFGLRGYDTLLDFNAKFDMCAYRTLLPREWFREEDRGDSSLVFEEFGRAIARAENTNVIGSIIKMVKTKLSSGSEFAVADILKAKGMKGELGDECILITNTSRLSELWKLPGFRYDDSRFSRSTHSGYDGTIDNIDVYTTIDIPQNRSIVVNPKKIGKVVEKQNLLVKFLEPETEGDKVDFIAYEVSYFDVLQPSAAILIEHASNEKRE